MKDEGGRIENPHDESILSILSPCCSSQGCRPWIYFLIMGIPIEPYDIVMVAVIFCCTLFGVWKGMAWQVAALAALVVSAIVASQYSGALAPHIKSASSPPGTAAPPCW